MAQKQRRIVQMIAVAQHLLRLLPVSLVALQLRCQIHGRSRGRGRGRHPQVARRSQQKNQRNRLCARQRIKAVATVAQSMSRRLSFGLRGEPHSAASTRSTSRWPRNQAALCPWCFTWMVTQVAEHQLRMVAAWAQPQSTTASRRSRLAIT